MTLTVEYCIGAWPPRLPRLSPYEDWVRRGSPEGACFSYATHTNETADYFVLIPHLDAFYMYVDMDYTTVECMVGFKADRGNRRALLTSAVCKTTNIWPELTGHDELQGGTMWGGIAQFRHAMHATRNAGLEEVMKYLFGRGWSHAYGRPAYMPGSMLDVGRAYDERCHRTGQPVRWYDVLGCFDTSRAEAAVKIQAAFRGWRVRLRYRFSPHNRLGRFVIERMMAEQTA